MAKFSMPCVVLCGGRSARMGRLKQDLIFSDKVTPIAQETLANFQAKRLLELFSHIYFSAKFLIPNAVGAKTILDNNTNIQETKNLTNAPKEQFAPIFGLQSSLEFLQCDFFALSVDAPFFDRHCVELVLQSYAENRKPTFARNSEIHPLLGVYTLESLRIIQAQIAKGDYKLMRLLEMINAQFVAINEDKTQNLNTPEDYQKALAQINSQLKA
ncbi:molybdenum cofactor guanylyltransferase [Helicobacter sp.]|uniref:molybdenum cofactor guanylyltransferase n=1 Tax=Helicobacter sp. TaxID=218 RepID=UPI0025BFDDE5|nr:molybdenum cofactor guanylyltransferase [Helicobacter sp.]